MPEPFKLTRIPSLKTVEPSVYAPRTDYDPPEPAWKSFPEFKDAVHPRQPAYRGSDDKADGTPGGTSD